MKRPKTGTQASSAYAILKAEADRVGWPVMHRDDLTQCDRARLSRRDAPKVFGWLLRESGTWFIHPATPDDPHGQSGHRAWIEAILSMPEAARHRCYWFADGRLIKLSWDQLRERLLAAPVDPYQCECANCQHKVEVEQRELRRQRTLNLA